MQMITPTLEKKLFRQHGKPADQIQPVLKIFNPTGPQTWLIASADPDQPDLLYGLADLGFGTPELGDVSRKELEQVPIPLERDRNFRPSKTLAQYAAIAFDAGRIQS